MRKFSIHSISCIAGHQYEMGNSNLIYTVICWSASPSASRSIRWFISQSTCRSVGWLLYCPINCLTHWFIRRSIRWSIRSFIHLVHLFDSSVCPSHLSIRWFIRWSLSPSVGLLVRWSVSPSVGPLVRWSVGPRFSHANNVFFL